MVAQASIISRRQKVSVEWSSRVAGYGPVDCRIQLAKVEGHFLDGGRI